MWLDARTDGRTDLIGLAAQVAQSLTQSVSLSDSPAASGPSRWLHPCNGASRYDVRIGGGEGSWKSGRSKGSCVNFIAYIRHKCGQGGGGSKNPKILWTSFKDASVAYNMYLLALAWPLIGPGMVALFMR